MIVFINCVVTKMPMCIKYDDALYSFMIFVLLLFYRDVSMPQYQVLADVIYPHTLY